MKREGRMSTQQHIQNVDQVSMVMMIVITEYMVDDDEEQEEAEVEAEAGRSVVYKKPDSTGKKA